MLAAEAVLTGWYVGFAIGLVVIVLVVVLVGIILGLARRIAVQAEAVTAALDDSRVNTLPLWEVARVNDGIHAITKQCATAREALGG